MGRERVRAPGGFGANRKTTTGIAPRGRQTLAPYFAMLGEARACIL